MGDNSPDGLDQEAAASPKPYSFKSTVTYASAEHAEMVKNALSVDPELRPAVVSRHLTVEGCKLVTSISATDLRTLRAAVGPYCDLLKLASRVLEAFGDPPASDNHLPAS
ncbi:hypothetical protein WJX73_009385 [Symbiochloris irregularis]|uniref:Transcription factor Pcc1 n=1 Tax=Symbiochloris irregularis TaxID=706552 RepID=A0AAW1P9U3_9CHLO